MTSKQPHVSIKDNKRIDFDIKNTKDCINKKNIGRHTNIITSVFQIISSLLPKQFQITLSAIAILILVYFLLRAGFLIYNQQYFAHISFKQILMTFVYGIRFDLSGILMLNVVIFGLYNLPGYSSLNRRFGYFLYTLFFVVNLTGIFLTIIDCVYYSVTAHRITYEALHLYLENLTLTMIWGMLDQDNHGDLIPLMIATGTGFVFFSNKIFCLLKSKIPFNFNFYRDFIFFIFLISLMTLGIRGGLQSQTIRQSHAFCSGDRAIGYATLNTTFNIILGMNKKSSVEQLSELNNAKSKKIVQKIILRTDDNIVPNITKIY